MNFDHLSDKSNYNPLKRVWFYQYPYYEKSTNMNTHYFIRAIGSILMLKLGYEFAIWETKEENEAFANSKMVEYISEEQIFNELYNKQKDAVLLHFYTPGHMIDQKFMRTFELESSNPKYKDMTFMNVHCRKHLNFCVNKSFKGRIFPHVEVYYINEKDEVEL